MYLKNLKVIVLFAPDQETDTLSQIRSASIMAIIIVVPIRCKTNKVVVLDQGWGKCGLFEEFVLPSNCLLTLPDFSIMFCCVYKSYSQVSPVETAQSSYKFYTKPVPENQNL